MENIIELSGEYVRQFLPKRREDSHKGTFGKVLNIAGSINYTGAAYLSSISALKVGAGFMTLASAESVIPIIASYSPDITYYDLEETEYGTISKTCERYLPDIKDYQVVSIGCGLSRDDSTINFVNSFLSNNKKLYTPFIIDADAINAVASNFFKVIPPYSLITPHPAELSRLLKIPVEQVQQSRVESAQMASDKFNCVTLLKGHQTVITTPIRHTYINTSGNSALSKAGMGDVLTGMIAGFCAQGLELEQSACLGAYLHGLAGELASNDLSEYCVLASDLLKYIPKAIKTIL